MTFKINIMKNILLIIFTVFFLPCIYSQEICDNGIDDDGDGLIDLNDDECDCLESIPNIIPNPSFEDMNSCPAGLGQLNYLTAWVSGGDNSPDYYNTCDYAEIIIPGYTSADLSGLPDGEGWVAYLSSYEMMDIPNPDTGVMESTLLTYLETIATCLDGPLMAGVEYTLHFNVAWGNGSANQTFCLYATPDCADLGYSSWNNGSCPTDHGSFDLLSSIAITTPTDGTWQEEVITFTPTIDYAAISFGGSCTSELSYRYTYIDNLILTSTADESYSSISETGNWCDGNLALHANIDETGGSWQWYKNNVALDGEIEIDIDVMIYGLGDYTAVYFLDSDCYRSEHTVVNSEEITANFEFTNACFGQKVDFTNTSIYDGNTTPAWHWNFANEDSSIDENPSYEFEEAGIYLVELIACFDTIKIEVIVDPAPIADFEFVNGNCGCLDNLILFNDLSTIPTPGYITEWDWNFGDSGNSTEINPEHIYDTDGPFIITLTVTSENECTDTDTAFIQLEDIIYMFQML